MLHGTTVATNMILEDKGARAALVTTKGFRHVLGIGRQDIPRKANLYTWVKPRRPVPPDRIVEVSERIAAGGADLLLAADSVVAAVAPNLPLCRYRHAEVLAAADSTTGPAAAAPHFAAAASRWPDFEHADVAWYRAGLGYAQAGQDSAAIAAAAIVAKVARDAGN